MFCLGPNPDPTLRVLSHAFYQLLVAGFFVGLAALLLALFVPRMKNLALIFVVASLVLLVEPVMYSTLICLGPALIHGPSHAETVAWLFHGGVPLALPVSALQLIYHRN